MYGAEVATDPEYPSQLRQNFAFFFGIRCQVKFLTCEISDFTPSAHAQSNILHIKYAKKFDDWGLGIRV